MTRQPTPNVLDEIFSAPKLPSVLPIDNIRTDGGTQPRAGLDAEYIAELSEALTAGATLPPVDVMYDGENYWLYDGFHRLAAHKHAEFTLIPATVHQGDQATAQWESYAANITHGLRRSQPDKERAIRAALKHPTGVKLANNLIAKHLGVSDNTVRKYREEMELTSQIAKSTERTGADGRTINTANIGANRPAAQSPIANRPAPINLPLFSQYGNDYEASADSADSAEVNPIDPWVASWEERYGDSTVKKADRLVVHLQSWAQAWTDDKGRTWRDVVERNPQHANSPFRQDLEAACRMRGLELSGEQMAETIRILFSRLRLNEPPAVLSSQQPDDRIGRAIRLIGIYELAISTADEYGELTGCYSETLAPNRELQKLINRLQRLADLLAGRTVEPMEECE